MGGFGRSRLLSQGDGENRLPSPFYPNLWSRRWVRSGDCQSQCQSQRTPPPLVPLDGTRPPSLRLRVGGGGQLTFLLLFRRARCRPSEAASAPPASDNDDERPARFAGPRCGQLRIYEPGGGQRRHGERRNAKVSVDF